MRCFSHLPSSSCSRAAAVPTRKNIRQSYKVYNAWFLFHTGRKPDTWEWLLFMLFCALCWPVFALVNAELRIDLQRLVQRSLILRDTKNNKRYIVCKCIIVDDSALL